MVKTQSGLCVSIIGLGLLVTVDSGAAQVPEAPRDTAAEIEEFEGPPVSPRGAFLRSLVLPGWGQAYAGAPGRGAVYASLVAGSLWMSYVSRRQLLDARRQQFWLREGGQIESTEETELVAARDDQFEDWVALSIFLFFLAGADAYVAAHLADFDERVGVQPGFDGSLRLQVSVPTGGGPR